MGVPRQLIEKLMQGYRLPGPQVTQNRQAEAESGTIVGSANRAGDGGADVKSDGQEDSTVLSRIDANHHIITSPVVDMVAQKAELQWLPPDQIEPHPFQPRTPEEQSMVENLRESIASCGQIVPAVVRRMAEGSERPYRLIEGHRRWEAVRQLNRTLLCYVIECTPHEEAIFLLAANLNRQELRYLPLSYAMRQIVELGVAQKELAAAIGWDPAAVSRCLRLSRLPSATLNWLNKQQWTYRKINLAVESCLRQGCEVGELSPEDLEQGLRKVQEEQEGATRNRFRLSIQLPRREANVSGENYERKALEVYYAGCAAGARDLWKTVTGEHDAPLENQLESVLYPAIEILRGMEPETGWTHELVWGKFVECWRESEKNSPEKSSPEKSSPEPHPQTTSRTEDMPEKPLGENGHPD